MASEVYEGPVRDVRVGSVVEYIGTKYRVTTKFNGRVWLTAVDGPLSNRSTDVRELATVRCPVECVHVDEVEATGKGVL